jgi:acetoin utilization protein AcuB
MSPRFRELRVADVMTADPVTLGPEDMLMRAVEVMRLHGIRRLPIVVGGRLVGVLAEGDLKRAQPSTLSDTQEEFDRVMEGTNVSRIMVSDPVTIAPDAPLLDAARTLQNNKFGALPVVEGGRLVGILTDNDLLRVLVDLLQSEDGDAQRG